MFFIIHVKEYVPDPHVKGAPLYHSDNVNFFCPHVNDALRPSHDKWRSLHPPVNNVLYPPIISGVPMSTMIRSPHFLDKEHSLHYPDKVYPYVPLNKVCPYIPP